MLKTPYFPLERVVKTWDRWGRSPFAMAASLPLLSISWLSRFTYLDSCSSVIPNSLTRFFDNGLKMPFKTATVVVSSSFIPIVALRMTISVTSSRRDLTNYGWQHSGRMSNKRCPIFTCNVLMQPRRSPFAIATSVPRALVSALRPSLSHISCRRLTVWKSAGRVNRTW